MKNHLFLLLFSLIFCLPAKTQNALLLTDTEKLDLPSDFNTLLPKELSEKIDANILLAGSLKAFRYGHLLYNDPQFGNIFIPGDGTSEGVYSAVRTDEVDKGSAYAEIPALFLKNKAIFETLYAAAMPLYQDLFKKMTPNEQAVFMNFFQKGLAYAKDFNLAKEKQDLASLGNAFAWTKGKLEAFIFRRIANNDFTKKECIYWLQKMNKDLEAVIPKTVRPEDQYVISPYDILADGYCWGYLHGNSEDAARKIFIQNADGRFAFLLNATDKIISQTDNKYILVEHKNQQQTMFVFDKDNQELPLKKMPLRKKMQRLEDGILYYEDNTAELISPSIDSGHFQLYIDKKTKNITRNFAGFKSYLYANYEDGTAELFLFDYESERGYLSNSRYSLPNSLMGITKNDSCAILVYENGNKELLYNKIRINLPNQYNYSYIEPLRENFLFLVDTNTNITHDPKIVYGVLSSNGKVLLEPQYTTFFTSPKMSAILFGQQIHYYTLYGVFDASFRQITPIAYLNETYSYEVDTETFEEKPRIPSDNKILLSKPIFDKEYKMVGMNSVLVDYDGKVVIPDNLGYIKRIELIGYSSDCFYTINDKTLVINKDTDSEAFAMTGKYALFDSQGKQLTSFVYNSIDYILDENAGALPYFLCAKGKKTEKIDLKGKKIIE